MTIKETTLLFGIIPVRRRTVPPGETITYTEMTPASGFKDIGKFFYGEAKTELFFPDAHTIFVSAYPIQYKPHAKYSDILPSFQPDLGSIEFESLNRAEIKTLPKMPGKRPFIQKKYSWRRV